jgi:hypothetical protein
VRDLGLTESEAREFLSRELEQAAASTSFYWESDDVEEAMDLIIEAVAKLIVANNKKIRRDLEQELRRATTR